MAQKFIRKREDGSEEEAFSYEGEVIEKQLGEGEQPRIRVLVSNGTPDKAGDVVRQNWRLDTFKKNPVVLRQHRRDKLPIGKAVDLEITERGLEATIKFFLDSEWGEKYWKYYQNGFLHSVSPMLVPEEVERREEEDGRILKKPRLEEISAVVLPMNADAIKLPEGEESPLSIGQSFGAVEEEIEREGRTVSEKNKDRLEQIIVKADAILRQQDADFGIAEAFDEEDDDKSFSIPEEIKKELSEEEQNSVLGIMQNMKEQLDESFDQIAEDPDSEKSVEKSMEELMDSAAQIRDIVSEESEEESNDRDKSVNQEEQEQKSNESDEDESIKLEIYEEIAEEKESNDESDIFSYEDKDRLVEVVEE